MFFIFPYRVKNPIKSFPIATISTIVLNIIIYTQTTHGLLEITDDAVGRYGFALGVTPWYTTFTSAFMHADPLHLIGNMVFLWVFGPPVEDRLGIGKYIFVYFLTGTVGDLLESLLGTAVDGQPVPAVGASACIMGIIGAYWYLFSWSTVCIFYFVWILWFWYGVWEVAAIWVVGIYWVLDIYHGVMSRAAEQVGGVANFAHAGGVAAGVLMCIVLRMKRDTQALSEAKAIQSDVKDLSLMSVHDINVMLQDDPGNPELIRALVKPAVLYNAMPILEDAMARAGIAVIDKDPAFVAYYLIQLKGRADIYKPVHMLRLAGLLERSGQAEYALGVYQLLVDRHPRTPDAETALYRMALVHWNQFRNAESARGCLREMAARFPGGPMTPFGRKLWNQLGGKGSGVPRQP